MLCIDVIVAEAANFSDFKCFASDMYLSVWLGDKGGKLDFGPVPGHLADFHQ